MVALAAALRRVGSVDEARVLARRLWRTVPPWRGVMAELDEPTQVREMIRQFEERIGQSPTAYTRLALLHASIGDSTRFFDAMEQASRAREIWPTFFSLSDPRFDFVRPSARFAAIVRGVGLDVDIFTSPTGGRVQ
jgi:hypothetical protein